mmetsp:Transcript_114997/g.365401  ORF Transcript_114997/g.365401 Transcript_114997/m.365401 type:complete len:656 (-) Transcript_114997:294-2261(-)
MVRADEHMPEEREASGMADFDMDTFWADWAHGKDSLQKSVQQHLIRQSELVTRLAEHVTELADFFPRAPSKESVRLSAASESCCDTQDGASQGGMTAAASGATSREEGRLVGVDWRGFKLRSKSSLGSSEASAVISNLPMIPASPRSFAERPAQARAATDEEGVAAADDVANCELAISMPRALALGDAAPSPEDVHDSSHSALATRPSWLEEYRSLRKADMLQARIPSWLNQVRRTTSMRRNWVETVIAWMEWWHTLEEPHRTGCMARVLTSQPFDLAVALVISGDALYTVYQVNYEMDTYGISPPNTQVVDWLFLSIYLVELTARMGVHRQYFFCNHEMAWNIMDFTLVMFSFFDSFLTLIGGSFFSVTFARSMRLFKVGKILRIFKSMRFLKELRVIMGSIYGSFVSLFWSLITIGMILYVFALFFVQQMAVMLTDEDADDPFKMLQRAFFRDVQRTMLTLVQSTMGGLDWDIVFKMIQPLGWVYCVAFIFYVAFFNFAVMNILTGIFVENAMKLCRPDDEEIQLQHQRKKKLDMKNIRHIVEAMDEDRNGTIRRAEFLNAAKHEEMVSRFWDLGIDIRNTERFFDTVVGVDKASVPIDEFVERAVEMQGQASNATLHNLMMHIGILERSLRDMHKDQVLVRQLERPMFHMKL